jgi:hypothetical protein
MQRTEGSVETSNAPWYEVDPAGQKMIGHHQSSPDESVCQRFVAMRLETYACQPARQLFRFPHASSKHITQVVSDRKDKAAGSIVVTSG